MTRSSFGQKLSAELLQEVVTLAECLDALEEGSLPAVADTLSQRLKSLEQRLEGCHDTAKHIHVIEPLAPSLTSQGERLVASKALLLERKLEKYQWRT